MVSYPDEKVLAPSNTIPLNLYPDSKSVKISESPVQTPIVNESDLPRQKWYQYFSPTDTPEERRLILKLDGLIMVFVFLAYWAKVLDSSATSTAYVSGMKEDLKLFGNELNYLNTVYMWVHI